MVEATPGAVTTYPRPLAAEGLVVAFPRTADLAEHSAKLNFGMQKWTTPENTFGHIMVHAAYHEPSQSQM